MESKKIVPIVLAVVILIIGLFIFAKRNKKEEGYTALNVTYKNETKEYCACFSGQKIDFTKEEFTGCSLSAVFGGIECDLKESIIKEESQFRIKKQSVWKVFIIY